MRYHGRIVERIAVFAALQWECRPVLGRLRDVTRERLGHFTLWRGRTPAGEVCLMKTGVGLERAAAAARTLSAAQGFALFVSTGCAGGLSPDLAAGDLAVATHVIGGAPGQQFATHAAQRARLCDAARQAVLRVALGPVLCSPHVLTTVAAKRAAAAAGPVAVEMEGAPIAAQAAASGIPFVSVRAIIDTADTELPHAGRFTDPRSGALKPLAIAAYIATHPGVLPELLAMQRMMKAAQQSLEQLFAAWLSATER